MTEPRADWWRHAVIYQIYIRSFADSDGDGVGDLAGITSRLPHLAALGVDAVWITPFYTSPQRDHGYDVADYRDVDPLFGSLEDADALLAQAHDLGLRVIVDLVPNHTSDEHAWFKAALAAGPGSPERARYLFRDSTVGPPNNWNSVFGGPAWTQVGGEVEADGQGEVEQGEDKQWYLHLFDATQPDLDWRNPEVPAMFEEVLRFWLDRGVDGFRVDVAHGLFKEASLRDQVLPEGVAASSGQVNTDSSMVSREFADEPMWDQPEVHDVYRSWHRILDEAGPDRMAVAEAWTQSPESMAAFVRPDELDQAFNFAWLLAEWSSTSFAEVITSTMAAVEPVGASPTWVLSNHDVVRHVTRYGGGQQGLRRARAATLTMLALPGASYIYQGEELGLEQVDVSPADRQDPSWLRTGEVGRDGCRVPIPWVGSQPPYGFGPGADQPWIPQPVDWAQLTVEAQSKDPASTLAFYRQALALRRDFAWTAGEQVVLLDLGPDVLALRRGPLIVVLNCGTTAVELPAGEVLISSAPVDGSLPVDTAVWLQRGEG